MNRTVIAANRLEPFANGRLVVCGKSAPEAHGRAVRNIYPGLDDFGGSLRPAMNTSFLEDRVQVIPYCEFTERQNAAHPGIGFSLIPK